MSDEREFAPMEQDVDRALALVGKFVKFRHQVTHAQAHFVTYAADGMVELAGWSGRFAADLFVVVEEA